MRVDPSQSVYHEDPGARDDFDRKELKRCRYLLRRLRFLEAQVRETGGIESGSGGAMHAEWEVEALEWALTELGFLAEDRSERVTSSR